MNRTAIPSFLFAITVAVDLTAQPTGTGIIAGTVVDSAGDAVRKAIVTVTWRGGPRSWATSRTDASGTFRFEHLPTGIYDLRASKEAEGVAVYGAVSTRETGENIKLGDGEIREGLKLYFIHPPSISGHVTDLEGDPVAKAQVRLLRTERRYGRPALATVSQVHANERGEYRFANVIPGQYRIYAFIPVQPPRRGPDDPFPVTVGQYYGGTRESKDASVVRVQDGETLRGIDVGLIAESSIRIRGRVTGTPEFPRPDNYNQLDPRVQAFGASGNEFVSVLLVPLTDNPDEFRQSVPATHPDYGFDFGWCVPGAYRVIASITFEGRLYSARQTLSGDLGLVTLALEPTVDISGSVRLDGQPSKSPIHISLEQADGVGPSPSAEASDRFKLEEVTPGEWDLFVELPHNAYLKSVHFGDDEVRLKSIAVKPGTRAALNIAISTRTAQIEGQVDSRDNDPASAGIVVVPVGEFHEFTRFYYAGTADDHGNFKLEGIAPGKYKVFALEKLSAAPFESPEGAASLVGQLGDLAAEIEVAEGASIEVHPRLIALERGREVLP